VPSSRLSAGTPGPVCLHRCYRVVSFPFSLVDEGDISTVAHKVLCKVEPYLTGLPAIHVG